MVIEKQTVNIEQILKARENIRGIVRDTGLLPVSSTLAKGGEIYLKAENLQRTGSFKLRGAYNRLLALTENEKRRGVITSSAGNHAQGVALAAKLLGIKAVIVMPQGAPLSKIEATRSYGAEIIFNDGTYDDAYERAKEIEHEKGYIFIHAFDDPLVIAGQGTIALEVLEKAPDCDLIAVPIGGGGLAAGIACAAKSINPKIRVVGVEPEDVASMYESFRRDSVAALPGGSSIADGVSVKCPGELTFSMCRKLLDDILLVSEGEIAATMLIMLERLKIVAEGSGAIALAALLNNKLKYKKAVAILSGGNIDVNILEQVIEKGLVSSGRRAVLNTIISDKPGKLSEFLELIAALGANILSVTHNRAAHDTPVGRVKINLEIETRDHLHTENIMRELHSHHII